MNKTIMLGKYEFEGPLHFSVNRGVDSGVFAALCEKDGEIKVLDIGEADAVRNYVRRYKQVPCWRKHCNGFIKLAGYYCNEEDRVRIAAELRAEFNPSCGG